MNKNNWLLSIYGKLSDQQRIVLYSGASLIGLLLIYPPWIAKSQNMYGVVFDGGKRIGHYLIFGSEVGRIWSLPVIDFGRLLIEIVAVILFTMIGIGIAGQYKAKSNSPGKESDTEISGLDPLYSINDAPVDDKEAVDVSQIQPWSRYLARVVDIIIVDILLIIIDLSLYIGLSFTPGIFLLVSLALYVIIEPIILSVFGNTPARAILGIRLTYTGSGEVSYTAYLRRSLKVWMYGWGLGIPVVSVFTLYYQFRQIKEHGLTTWDEQEPFRVYHAKSYEQNKTPITLMVIGLTICVLLGL
jgi:hypothetical protein